MSFFLLSVSDVDLISLDVDGLEIFSFFTRFLFERTALRSVECKNLLLTLSFGFTQPLGPNISARLAPTFASSSNASSASLEIEIIMWLIEKNLIKNNFSK